MKAAVFFDGYLPYHGVKDPGLIPLGLNRMGCDTCLVTLMKPQLATYKCPFSLISAQRERLQDAGFWRHLEADVVICYTWLEPSYNSILTKMIEGGKRIVIKADTDGRLGYPAMPRYVRDPASPPLRNLSSWFRHTRAFGRFGVSYGKGYRVTMPERMKQIQLSSAVIFESPKAVANVSNVLDYWRRPDLASKVHFVPNPVAGDILAGEVRAKQNVTISIGRWEDPAKNASLLIRSMRQFLEVNPQWRLRVVGDGERTLEQTVSAWRNELREKVEILGQVSHSKVVELLADSRVLYMPSKTEGFPIVAAEAVCMGCSIVGTPLESLDFLAANGFSGTLSEGFSSRHLTRALTIDVSKHAEGAYDPVEIAGHWRSTLSIDQVSAQIYEIIRKL